jgi:hypothetical protein
MRRKLWMDRISNENGNLCVVSNVGFFTVMPLQIDFVEVSEYEGRRSPKTIL